MTAAALDHIRQAAGGAAASPEFLQQMREGLPVEAVRWLAQDIAPSESGFAERLVPRATLARFKARRRLSQAASERIVRISNIWNLALTVFQNRDKAYRFLTTPNLMLGNQLPLDVALDGEAGGRRVENILGRLLYGAAA
ncbi:MAG: DUF2384 domain-containing protein [Asticcacaulis sp.]|uniref:antitoxin Xre/MbcA/ParS toxin-binding domain-containing protein n=1 Tax=Asticcacaulis sp. TaxID=1872648 RepID=UPI0039E5565D